MSSSLEERFLRQHVEDATFHQTHYLVGRGAAGFEVAILLVFVLHHGRPANRFDIVGGDMSH